MAKSTILSVNDLTVTLDRGDRDVDLIRGVGFEVRAGEIVTLVGESGSGKSVTSRTIMGLMQLDRNISATGSIIFDGQQLVGHPEATAKLRGTELAMVFQEPLSSLDPVFPIEDQMREGLRRAHGRSSKQAEKAKMEELLREVGIRDTDRVLNSFPHQLSGGMCQRVMIASALSSAPRLLIADEPTTALDVTIQAQILDLIDRLREENDMSVLLVTHDMGVAADLADRVVVMYAGRVVEDSSPRDIFTAAQHPYTEGLLGCIPPMTGQRLEILPAIPGSVPDPAKLPGGCAFNPRCAFASDRCRTDDPPLLKLGGTHAACWHPRHAEDQTALLEGARA
ncbi:ABC transporter ATP-binding protein [Propionibacteriaceae bacterium G57]|uniref:ABC transporter ATP-binding protein n=1 Tax=Aestuariimicrobium sp. G57 TaxID=3418485 RepID=UPI003DA76FE5